MAINLYHPLYIFIKWYTGTGFNTLLVLNKMFIKKIKL